MESANLRQTINKSLPNNSIFQQFSDVIPPSFMVALSAQGIHQDLQSLSQGIAAETLSRLQHQGSSFYGADATLLRLTTPMEFGLTSKRKETKQQ